jgi:uncharacterized protein (TIGR03000 family)
MYSVVLMAAMTTTPVTPEGLFHKGGGGCCGETSCGCSGQTACGCGGGSGGHRAKKQRHHSGGGCCGQTACGCCGVPVQSCGCCGGGMMTAPQGGTVAPMPAPGPAPKPMGMANPNAATIVVTGAKDAKVLIGGLVSAGNDETRTMVSPSLDAGEVYHYDLTAEVVRDGQTVRLTQAVTVKPGETTEVKLDFAAGSVVMK